MKILRLDVGSYQDGSAWTWTLSTADGEPLLEHAVRLPTGDPEFLAFVDFNAHMSLWSTGTTLREPEIAVAASKWIGDHVFGAIGDRLVHEAELGPIVVCIRFPEEASQMYSLCFDAASLAGRPLYEHGITLVFDPPASAPSRVALNQHTLRVLAVFSLPAGEPALALRRERAQLSGCFRGLVERTGLAIDLHALQYGVTRDRLREALSEPEGWDIVHFSGHGLPGGLLLEGVDGNADVLGTTRLTEMLAGCLQRLKLVVLASCSSAARVATGVLREHGLLLPQAWEELDDDVTLEAVLDDISGILGTEFEVHQSRLVDGAPKAYAYDNRELPTMACSLASSLGCAVLATRYAVPDSFLRNLLSDVYDAMIGDEAPLPIAVQRGLQAAHPGTPVAALYGVALFGQSCADLRLPVERPADVGTRTSAPTFGLPPLGERFVGRTQLLAAAGTALSAQSDYAGLVLYGLPGIGKTACARELVDLEGRNFDQIIWYSAAGHEMNEALSSLAGVLCPAHPEIHSGAHNDELAKLIEDALGRQRVLLILDGLGDDIPPVESNDPAWKAIVNAAANHAGPSRTVITRRNRLSEDVTYFAQLAVHPLAPAENVLLLTELPSLAYMAVDGDVEQPHGRAAFLNLFMLTRGHPRLLELADSLARTPRAFFSYLSILDTLPESLDADEISLDSSGLVFLRSYIRCIRTLIDDLSSTERHLFLILSLLEEEDRLDGWLGVILGVLTRPQVAESLTFECVGLAENISNSMDDLVAAMAASGLVEVVPIPAGGLGRNTFRIHPVIAAIGRSLAADSIWFPALLRAASMFWYLFHRYSRPYEMSSAKSLVLEWSRRALPYALRSKQWDEAREMIQAVIVRDSSDAAATALIPSIERLVADTAGTEDGLINRALLARVRSFINPSSEEMDLEGLLAEARDRNMTHAAAVILTDLIRIRREAGRLSEALSCADEVLSLMRAEDADTLELIYAAINRLQLLTLLGRSGEALREVATLEKEFELLDPPPELEREGVERWQVVEGLWQVGAFAARGLGDWDRSLEFNAKLLMSLKRRGASEVNQMAVAFNDYLALMNLNRWDDARELLMACKSAFDQADDRGQLGNVFGALGTLEYSRNHFGAAIDSSRRAVQLHYESGDVSSIATDHSSIAMYMRATGGDPAQIVAHYLVSLLVSTVGGDLQADGIVRDISVFLETETNALPESLNTIEELVQLVPGVNCHRLRELLKVSEREAWLIMSDAVGQVRERVITRETVEAYRSIWRVVGAAVVATLSTDSNATAWLGRWLNERERADDSSGLLTMVRRLMRGEDNVLVPEGLNVLDAVIAQELLDLAYGRRAVDPGDDEAWRAMDYLEAWEPVISDMVLGLSGDDEAMARARDLLEQFRDEERWVPFCAVVDRVLCGDRVVDSSQLSAWDRLVVTRLLSRTGQE